MNLKHALFAIFAVIGSLGNALAEEALKPLDRRTRCIVLFRECLVLLDSRDVDGILRNIADGSGHNKFDLYANQTELPLDLVRELQDADQFFKHNFPKSSTISKNFREILFSAVSTTRESVRVNTVKAENQKGKLHIIKIKIPEVEDGQFSELRFIELEDRLYWVPFGW